MAAVPVIAVARGSLSERQSYIVVGLAHVLLFAVLSISLRSVTPPPPPVEGVPVEIVSSAEAKAAAQPSPSLPRPAPHPAPRPAPEPEPAPPPKPAPAEAEPAEPVDEVAQPAKIKPRKAKPEKPKAEPKPLDTAALSRLLDTATPKPKPLDTKALSRSLAAAIPKTRPLDTAALAKSLDAALPKGPAHAVRGDPRATAAIAAAIRAQVTPCWTLPVGGGTTGKVTALLHIAINRDGSIAGRPSVVSQTGVTATNADYGRAFAEAARRAVLRCAPLKLPADQYEQWQTVEINFDPANF